MNRDTIIGLILIAAVFVGWSIWMSPSKEELVEKKHRQDSVITVQRINDSLAYAKKIERNILANIQNDAVQQQNTEIIDSEVAEKIYKEKFGVFANSSIGEDKLFNLENDVFKINVSSKGGKIQSVELKNYSTYDSLPLILFDSDSAYFGFNFFALNRLLNTNDLYFQPYWPDHFDSGKDKMLVSESDSVVFAMRLYPNKDENILDESKYIEYLYTIRGDDYMLGFSINIVGMQDIISTRLNNLDLIWKNDLRKQEKSVDRWNGPTIYYKYYKEDVDYLSETKDDEEKLNTNAKWVSFKQHFFSSILIAENYFVDPELKVYTDPNATSDRYLKSMNAMLGLPYTNQAYQSIPMSFYFGPNRYNTLRQYHQDFERQIPLGWSFFLLAWVNTYAVIPVFNLLEGTGIGYGLIILILTILIKLVLFPIAYKTYKSSAKMRVLKPEIDEISKKFPKKEDSMKKQQATMALYKKAGVNPMAGCVPMLLQMPILLAMFRFFPSSIELRQQSFLWATDLSTYDSIWTFPNGFSIPFYGDHVSLFTLLMTVSTVLYTKVNNQMMGSSQQMPGMKTMMYLMPIMFLGIFNNYAAGLSYYYFLANIITFAQMYLIKRTINEKKLKLQIAANKKKPKKKSGFQKRLEDAAKKQGYKQKRK